MAIHKWNNTIEYFQAGITPDQLTLALEPEAASIYCQFNQYGDTYDICVSNAFRQLVQEKRKYMVVDLGGR